MAKTVLILVLYQLFLIRDNVFARKIIQLLHLTFNLALQIVQLAVNLWAISLDVIVLVINLILAWINLHVCRLAQRIVKLLIKITAIVNLAINYLQN